MLEEGLPADSIKTALKLSRTTFFQGKRAYQGHGAEGLKVWPIPGGTPKLTDQQTSQLLGGWSAATRGSFSSTSGCGRAGSAGT